MSPHGCSHRLHNFSQVGIDAVALGGLERITGGGLWCPSEASITTQDGKLKALVKPDQSHYLIEASASAWTVPFGPALVFDELVVKGVATRNDAKLDQVNASLYGGTDHGKAAVSWQTGVQLNGSFDVAQVEMQKIVSVLTSRSRVSGKLNAKPVFSASAPSVNQLMSGLRLETPFSVQNGVLHGVDIQKAATGLVKQGAAGGETRFDQLSGHLVLERGNYRFTQLRIASGVLFVDGDVNVSPRQELSGRVNAQVKALSTSAQVPLNVSGTVDAPVLYPTGGTVAGAALGTVILGPGIGTSVGAKIGGWVEGLLGKKQEKKSR